MRRKSESQKPSSERIAKDIRRAARKQYSAEEKIRIVLDGLRGEVQHRGAVPARGHCREPVLQLVEGVSRNRQAIIRDGYGRIFWAPLLSNPLGEFRQSKGCRAGAGYLSE